VLEDSVLVVVAEEDQWNRVANDDVAMVHDEVVDGVAVDFLGSGDVTRVDPLAAVVNWMARSYLQSISKLAHPCPAVLGVGFDDADDLGRSLAIYSACNSIAFLEISDQLGGRVRELDDGISRKTAAATAVIATITIIIIVVIHLGKLRWLRNYRHWLANFVPFRLLRRVHFIIDIVSPVSDFLEELTSEGSEARISEVVLDLHIQ